MPLSSIVIRSCDAKESLMIAKESFSVSKILLVLALVSCEFCRLEFVLLEL